MDFGAFILFQRLDESVATKDVYRHSLDLVCRAEELGFSTAGFQSTTSSTTFRALRR